MFDEVRLRAEMALVHIGNDWSKLGKVRPIAVAWVSEAVSDDRGMPVEDSVVCLLPDDVERHQKAMQGLVERTKALALLVIKQQEDDVVASFETPVGSTVWRYRIEDRVDRKIVVLTGSQQDVPCTGLLWKPSSKMG